MSGLTPGQGSFVPPPLRNPYIEGRVSHPTPFRRRRFMNWFPLGIAYAMLYMGRYNLTVAQGALGDLMPKDSFGVIFMVGAIVYGVAFVLNGPLTDRIGGKRAMLLGLGGAFVANLLIGLYVKSALLSGTADKETITVALSGLYAANMYFQSFGAVAIVKVNASWFHVRERGSFSGIFGTMISLGLLFAFDVNERILGYLDRTKGPGELTPAWIVFFVPAAALATMFVIELVILRDWPSHAGHVDIDTGDASSGEEHLTISSRDLIVRILSNPVILTVAAIEFCTGVLRNGVMHWFRIYAKEQVQAIAAAGGPGAVDAAAGWTFTLGNWGAILCVAGIVGGFFAGFVSDFFFQSRRAPAAALLYGLVTACVAGMFFALGHAWLLCTLVFLISIGVIGTHGLLSGTATMDFGGRKGAATAVGIIDGFVYLGTALQSGALGYITSSKTLGWSYWPAFLLPFGIIGLLLLARIWHAIPKGKKSGGH